MIFIFGVRLFGKVDVVPGRFYVATEFYHIQFVPIVPMQTYLVLEEDADGWRGVTMQQCRKSIKDAWQRRFERVDRQAGPYWPSWRCCFSWTAAEASRRAG